MNTAESHLRRLRRYEFERIRGSFRPGMQVLELGGGSGYQASLIAATGAHIRSLDLPNRDRSGETYWDVEDYDGVHIDAADGSFDIVFTSNVLEHIRTLEFTLSEIRRVLRFDGSAIHVLPSASWRLWSSFGHPAAVARSLLRGAPPRSESSMELATALAPRRRAVGELLRLVFVAEPHGEFPSATSELWHFSRFRWKGYFAARGWTVQRSFGNGLFYTGWEFLPQLPIVFRRAGAFLLGSSTRTFILAPN